MVIGTTLRERASSTSVRRSRPVFNSLAPLRGEGQGEGVVCDAWRQFIAWIHSSVKWKRRPRGRGAQKEAREAVAFPLARVWERERVSRGRERAGIHPPPRWGRARGCARFFWFGTNLCRLYSDSQAERERQRDRETEAKAERRRGRGCRHGVGGSGLRSSPDAAPSSRRRMNARPSCHGRRDEPPVSSPPPGTSSPGCRTGSPPPRSGMIPAASSSWDR